MAEPVPRRLRIVVVGPSVGYFVRPPRSDPDDGSYPELLERRLRAEGVHAEVVNSSGWFLLVHEAFRDLETLVLRHAPDVVITNFGMGECQPKVIPTTLLRWLYTFKRPSHVGGRLIERLFAEPVTALYTSWSPRVIAALPWVPYRVSPKRFRYEMLRLVRLVRKERQALVLMLTANPAGPKLEGTLPGTDERSQQFNAIIGQVAERHGPDARVVDARAIVLAAGIEKALPDGIHFSAHGHRLIADALFDEIQPWLVARGWPGATVTA
jgi:lysophospholipase L1-like esterase